jgi:hypothetical protein
VILWNLADRAVGARKRSNHTRHGSRTHARSAVSLRHSDREQARIGDEVHLLIREDAISIAGGGAFRKFRGDLLGDCKRLCVVADAAPRLDVQGRRAKLNDLVFDCRDCGGHARRVSVNKATSAPSVARGRDAVKEVVADMEIFPAHGIMERVGARIAPMAVEIVLAKG